MGRGETFLPYERGHQQHGQKWHIRGNNRPWLLLYICTGSKIKLKNVQGNQVLKLTNIFTNVK